MAKEEFQKIVVLGSEYKTRLTKKYENRRKWEAPNPKEVKAYIPGTIIEVKVKEGQEVKEGDLLLILEAMKMKNEITAPIAGVISKILVKTEEKVPKNHLMILFK